MDSTPTLRFAVTSFGDWARAQKATEALRVSEKPLTEISYLGLRTVLKDLPAQALADLSFPRDGGRIACSVGPIAERLAAKVDAGAPSLQAALATWLIPRHAAQLQRAADAGKIVLWVRLVDADDERLAYRTLLATGCGSVGVHDLVGA